MDESKDERRAASQLYPEPPLEMKATTQKEPRPVLPLTREQFQEVVKDVAQDGKHLSHFLNKDVVHELKEVLEVVRRQNGLSPKMTKGPLDHVGLEMMGMGLLIGFRLGELYGERS